MKVISVKVSDEVYEKMQGDIPVKYATVSEIIRDLLREKYRMK